MRPRLISSRRFLKPAILFSCVLTSGAAQDLAILSNHGEPMRVPYACAEEELQFAGMSCSEEESCAIYLELTSVASNGNKIFTAGNLHSTSATLGSVLLASEDAGATWKEPAARIQSSALDQMQFLNSQAGWAAGETQYPLPRDPFFLVTTDGGDSWRNKPVGEDGFAGAIQRFWFDSPQHGELIVDGGKSSESGRYLSFDSQTGGETWTLLGKSDQLPKLRHEPPAQDDGGWRLRPSKDGKAFQLEQQAGTQWRSIASFLVEVANCQRQVESLPEPEPQADKPAVPEQPSRKPKR